MHSAAISGVYQGVRRDIYAARVRAGSPSRRACGPWTRPWGPGLSVGEGQDWGLGPSGYSSMTSLAPLSEHAFAHARGLPGLLPGLRAVTPLPKGGRPPSTMGRAASHLGQSGLEVVKTPRRRRWGCRISASGPQRALARPPIWAAAFEDRTRGRRCARARPPCRGKAGHQG